MACAFGRALCDDLYRRKAISTDKSACTFKSGCNLSFEECLRCGSCTFVSLFRIWSLYSFYENRSRTLHCDGFIVYGESAVSQIRWDVTNWFLWNDKLIETLLPFENGYKCHYEIMCSYDFHPVVLIQYEFANQRCNKILSCSEFNVSFCFFFNIQYTYIILWSILKTL